MWHLVVELQGHVTVTKYTSRENVVSNSTEEDHHHHHHQDHHHHRFRYQ